MTHILSGSVPDLSLYRPGRRRLTPAMLAARDELTTPPPALPGKIDMLRLLRSLRGSATLTRGGMTILLAMVEKTRAQSWEAPETPFIYAHNTTLMEWTGFSLTALRRHIRDLAEAGMLVPQDGRNGQRGRRWQGGEDPCQVGFNLASLRYRWPELIAQADEARRRRETIAFLRSAIADLNEQVRDLAERRDDLGSAHRAVSLMRRRLRTTCVGTLEAYHLEMAGLYAALRDASDRPPHPVDKPGGSGEWTPVSAPMPPQSGAHYTNTKNIQLSKKVVSVAAAGRNGIEDGRPTRTAATHARVGNGDRSALRGFKATSQFLLEACPPLRSYCSSERPSTDELVNAAELLSNRLGISYHAWSQGCRVLGRFQAAIGAIVMTARRDHGATIRSPDAYFRSLVERGLAGTLFLDRSLYALRKPVQPAGVR